MKLILSSILMLSMLSMLSGYTQSLANEVPSEPSLISETYSSIYWSDGDSGRLGKLKFRLANIDAPETRSMKQRGGAKCEYERELGFEASLSNVRRQHLPSPHRTHLPQDPQLSAHNDLRHNRGQSKSSYFL